MDYMHMGYGMGGFGLGVPFWAPSLLLLAVVWSLLWKGLALWRSAQRGEKWWFIAFLLLNTLGILEIVYLFVITGAKLTEFTDPLTKKSEHNHHHQ